MAFLKWVEAVGASTRSRMGASGAAEGAWFWAGVGSAWAGLRCVEHGCNCRHPHRCAPLLGHRFG